MRKLSILIINLLFISSAFSTACGDSPSKSALKHESSEDTLSTSKTAKAPVIKKVNPANGAVGTKVTISGNNFSAENNKNVVRFGDAIAQVNNATKTKLIVTIPYELTTDKVAPDKGIVQLEVSVNGKKAKSSPDFKITQNFKSPPLGGTIFEDPDIITSSDPTSFSKVIYKGREQRQIFDRRSGYVKVNVYLVHAHFDDGQTVEVDVNPEFDDSDAALEAAKKYLTEFGRIPRALRNATHYVYINKGVKLWGGGSEELTIHTGQGDKYESQGIIPETMVHECTHILDFAKNYSFSDEWKEAVQEDPTAISPYAKNNPDREDIAESFLPYLAIRYRPSRVSNSYTYKVKQAIPNRIAYFDSLSEKLDLAPFKNK